MMMMMIIVEKIKTHVLYSVTSCTPENRAVYENVGE